MATIVLWAAAFAVYLLFAGTVSLHELVTACVMASLASLWGYALREVSGERFAASLGQIPPMLRTLAGLPVATGRTGAILIAAAATGSIIGRAVRTRIEPGPRYDPAGRSRRALAVLAASLAPPRFVVAFERGRAEAILHAIERVDAPPDPKWLT